MKIQFWGATEGVTGSKTFVNTGNELLLIDAGLYQGLPDLEEKNKDPLPFRPADIHAILLTHAHLDHSGYLPRLIKGGFQGKIYTTPATEELTKVILMDSASLVEDDFYGPTDVQETLRRIKRVEWNEKFNIGENEITFLPAGHILGASCVLIENHNKRILFSGDLGRQDDPLLPPPNEAVKANAIIMESTYGNKVRSGNYQEEILRFLKHIKRGDKVGIIASFAVARAQSLIHLIQQTIKEHPDLSMPLYADSPMMNEANRIYRKYSHLTHAPQELYQELKETDFIEHERERKSAMKKSGPMILISSSGMLTGGRIKQYLTQWKDEKQAVLFLPGFQSKGTPGWELAQGLKRFQDTHGVSQNWEGEVWHSEAFSSHADQNELLQWCGKAQEHTSIYLIHGEEESKTGLKAKLESHGFPQVIIPSKGSVYRI